MDEGLTERLLAFLRANDADVQVLRHQPVRTSEEAAQVRGTALEQGAKALVFQADEQTLLLVLQAHRRVDTRAFKRAAGVKNLRMISPEDLLQRTGLEVGAVPPFGHLIGFPTYVDERLLALPRIAFNAGSRSTSVLLATTDFVRLEQPVVGRFAADDVPGDTSAAAQR
ncbi:MAG TPA: YbaK/EbsC family protein [Chloroflexota bacterium]|jgi:prolyl-tRNA editing enzyme YbaK/EbsC (Cys-tRNA(Pro) deacylase)|nr:YbaK/EbsC family protein [Chloroflexota bacterium]